MESKKETAAGLEGVTQVERSMLNASPADPSSKRPDKGQTPPKNAENKPARKKRHPAVRALRWTLLKSIVPVLCVAAVIAGMYIGYAVLGKRPGAEIFDIDTWKHMYDLVFAD
ncbi:DNA-directed RNA polymerase subunit beta [Paenibacillus sp. R14(2021)]|uniref:DNA-directed RNA polymerase subunit beta n=1 Tax=Paenibacillus sp. R14(2021) TaxID=2859228 RepID=UPI0021576D28|nr:DNA-directed RNA polymerase subunit beta [Paenibacillus sp. R14(2021)]